MKDGNWGGWGCVVALSVLVVIGDVLPRLIGDLFHRTVSGNTVEHLVLDTGLLAVVSLGLGLWKLGVRLLRRGGP